MIVVDSSALVAILENETDAADVLIQPEVGDMHLYDFDRQSTLKAIVAGERAAEAQIPAIRKILRRQTGTASSGASSESDKF